MPGSEFDLRNLTARLAALLLCLALGGCLSAEKRSPAPRGILDSGSSLGNSAGIRFWGDKVSPIIRTVIRQQYEQVKRNGPAWASAEASFLAISGGGADGAYAAGFLNGWTQIGTRPNFEVVTGVSTGALAAPFAFLGPGYDQQLKEIFTAYSDRDLYIDRGLIGLLGKAVYDTAPLKALIDRYMTDEVLDAIAAEYRKGRRLLVQTTDLDAERPVIWDLSAIAASGAPDRRVTFTKVLLASTAIPGLFPPVDIDVTISGKNYDELHVDGGVASQIFFAPPELRLSHFEKDAFGHRRKHALYVIRNGRLSPQYLPAEATALEVTNRSITALIKYQTLADIRSIGALAKANHSPFAFTSIPESFTLIRKSPFDHDYMNKLYEVGYQQAVAGPRWTTKLPETLVDNQ